MGVEEMDGMGNVLRILPKNWKYFVDVKESKTECEHCGARKTIGYSNVEECAICRRERTGGKNND